MKNFIKLNSQNVLEPFPVRGMCLQAVINELQSEVNKKITITEFSNRLRKIEDELRYNYDANFTVKQEKKENTIYCGIYLNDKILINFEVSY